MVYWGGRDIIYCGSEMWITRRPVAENLLLLSPAELTSRSSFHRPVRGLFPLGAVQRMWKKPVKSPDVTTVFVSPFKENSTLRCSYTVIYLHSVVFCAFQEIFFFFGLSEEISFGCLLCRVSFHYTNQDVSAITLKEHPWSCTFTKL